MIYTITLNPALDYIIKLKELVPNEINTSESEYILPGGKGINVSIILKRLNVESVTLGFISGFTGKEIQKLVEKEKIQTDFINLEEGHSRINVKILEDEKETAINSKGPLVDNKSIEKLYQKLSNLKENDILVLSGSIPKGIKEDIYEEICEKIKDKNVKIVVDSTKKLLLNTLKYRPFLIKPNHHELGEIFNVQILNQDQAIEYAKKLQQKGAQNVLVSMGEKGSILLDENGKSYKKAAISNKNVINTVGAGDSMVAGFLAGYLNYKNHEDALKLGIASASATVNNVFLGTKDEI
ncbi:MAG: 1-phosphofructokinase, partial [Clostridia bacterium]